LYTPTVLRIVLTAVAALALAGCGSSGAGDSGTQVVASFYPLAFAAEQIAGADASVTNLTPAGVEPHEYELSVDDVKAVQQADVVLYLGGGFQPSLEAALDGARGTKIDLLEELGVDQSDPHVWLDPKLYAKVATEIGAALGEEAAAEELAGKAEELAAEYHDGLESCDRRDIVTSHAAYGHLARAYDLNQVPIAGNSPEAEASPQDLQRIADFVEESGATTIFVEPLAPPDEAETIARETGAQTATLDPIESAAPGEGYFSLMRANLEALRKALGCR
jgi:zinc transport system substrate-binding protein